MNPAGGRTNAVFTNDAQGGANFTWNTYWDARAVRDADGWYAEIRVPLSSLRFEGRDGVVVMGMTVWRRIARKNEMISWPGIENRWGANSMFKAPQAAEVELHGIARTNPVYVTSYALGGGTRRHALATARDTYELHERIDREIGMDVKYSPTSNLTLDVTINTRAFSSSTWAVPTSCSTRARSDSCRGSRSAYTAVPGPWGVWANGMSAYWTCTPRARLCRRRRTWAWCAYGGAC